MSHGRHRKETNCLNCGTTVVGRYCHICGQENTEPKETLWSMISHFFNDITHFDGKFFSTMGILFRRPGFLSAEYIAGRRNRYLNPIRMYIFTSAVFFLIIFSIFPPKKIFKSDNVKINGLENTAIVEEQAMAKARSASDSAQVRQVFALLDDAPASDTTIRRKNDTMRVRGTRYHSVAEYDSVQARLPAGRRDGWLVRSITRKSIELNRRYEGRSNDLVAFLADKFLHTLPYMLFVSLPLYAFFLYLLYIRRRRQLYYADHGMYLIHLYIFTFLLLLLYFILQKVKLTWDWDILDYIQAALLIYGVYYALKAMKNFYRQGWGKTILKFILFNFICLIALSLLFAIFLSYSIYQA